MGTLSRGNVRSAIRLVEPVLTGKLQRNVPAVIRHYILKVRNYRLLLENSTSFVNFENVFSRFVLLHIFSRLAPVACFRALETGCMFSLAWYRFRVFPLLQLVFLSRVHFLVTHVCCDWYFVWPWVSLWPIYGRFQVSNTESVFDSFIWNHHFFFNLVTKALRNRKRWLKRRFPRVVSETNEDRGVSGDEEAVLWKEVALK